MNNITVQPLASSWMAFLILLPLAYFLWREYQRKLRFRTLRIMAQTLLFLALLGVYFRPGFYQQKTSEGVLLLTSGYSASTVDSVLKAENGLSVVHKKGVPSYRGSVEWDDRDLERNSSSIRWVAGEGFSFAELDRIKDVHFKFLPTSMSEGIQSLEISRDVTVGNTAVISGTINSSKNQWLRLSGPGGVEDSAQLSPGRSSFRLSFIPKKIGTMLYHLQLGEEVKEPVPVVVKQEEKLRILFLQNYPTAESHALKNFLEEKGHVLVVRQQLSKENFLFSFSNTTPTRFSIIDEKLLKGFDVLVIDEASLGSFTKRHQAALLAAVENGLGVHVLPWEEFKKVDWIFPTEPEKTDQDTLHVKLRKSYVLQRSPYQWQERQGFIPVWRANEKILSGYFLMGKGKVSSKVITETFPIRFQGDEKDYAQVWSQLITRIARTTSRDRLSIQRAMPIYSGDPLTIELITKRTNPTVNADDLPVSLREETFVDQVWKGKLWAGEAGWHKITSEEDTLHYWVSKPEEWRSLGLAHQRDQNSLKQGNDSTVTAFSFHFREIPLLFYFIVFLMAAGFLWLAPKL